MYISLSEGQPSESKSSGVTTLITRTSSVVVMLGIVSMFTDISSESVASILPLYITTALGLSTIAFGFIDGLYQGVSAVVRIGGGWASDRADQPKWIAFAGYAISALAKVWLLFATGFGAITAVITIDRLGKGIRTAPRDALITASSDQTNLGRSFGVHRMLDTIGAAVGPLLAFLILSVIPTGYSTVFVVSLAFGIGGVIILGLLVPNRRPRADRARPQPSEASASRSFHWRGLTEPKLKRIMAVAGILGLLTIGDGFIYLVLQSRGSFAAQWFPLLYVGTNVAFLALAIPLGRLADRFGRGRVFIVGHVSLVATYVVAVLPFNDFAATLLCLALLGAFYAATDGVVAALAGEFSPPDNTASGIAAVQTVVAIARLISTTVFGVLWFAIGRVDALVLVTILLILVVPATALFMRPLFSARAAT
jgi:MFS family permease